MNTIINHGPGAQPDMVCNELATDCIVSRDDVIEPLMITDYASTVSVFSHMRCYMIHICKKKIEGRLSFTPNVVPQIIFKKIPHWGK